MNLLLQAHRAHAIIFCIPGQESLWLPVQPRPDPPNPWIGSSNGRAQGESVSEEYTEMGGIINATTRGQERAKLLPPFRVHHRRLTPDVYCSLLRPGRFCAILNVSSNA